MLRCCLNLPQMLQQGIPMHVVLILGCWLIGRMEAAAVAAADCTIRTLLSARNAKGTRKELECSMADPPVEAQRKQLQLRCCCSADSDACAAAMARSGGRRHAPRGGPSTDQQAG